MAITQILTKTLHLECIALTASTSANTIYPVLSATSSYDRRIYGMGLSSTSANTQTIKMYLNDGVTDYQVSQFSLAANSGNSISLTPYDVMGDANTKAIFGKRADVIGVFYFNLPKNWSIRASYGTTLTATATLTFTSQGELYDGVTTRHTSNSFSQAATFSNATGTTETNILDSKSYDRRVYAISASSTDATARTLALKLNNGTTSYLLYTISILANSGNTTTITSTDIFYDTNSFSIPFFNQLAEPDSGQYYFNIPAGWKLTGTMAGSVAIGSQITIETIGDTYE
jgi:hypothetical protein